MAGTTAPLFADWDSFYVITGTASAALTGLMFVAVTVIPPRVRGDAARTLSAFATPTIVHFSASLFVAAVLSAPWHHYAGPSWTIGVLGVVGVLYTLLVMQRARTQTMYQPVREDWIFHALLPLTAYGTFVVAGILLPHEPQPALFLTGAASLLQLFIGIHNAWDNLTFGTAQNVQGDAD